MEAESGGPQFEGSILQLRRALHKGGNIYTQYSYVFFYPKLKSDNFRIFSSDQLESQDPHQPSKQEGHDGPESLT